MLVKVFWTSRDWAEALAELPIQGSLPCRTALIPRQSVAHVLRRELIRSGRGDALAGTRFVLAPAAAVEVLRGAAIAFKTGEEDLRAARLLVLFRSDLRLEHFPLDLLRVRPGWNDAFAHTISDLEGAGLRPEDLDGPGVSGQLRDVATIWRALDESAGRSWTVQRIYRGAAVALERCPENWPFHGAVLASASSDCTAAEARFLKAIPQATIGVLAGRPARKRYLDRMKGLLGAEIGTALRSAEAPRAAGSERDLLGSYFFEPPVLLADPKRPKSIGPDGTVDLEEHAGIEAELEATANWLRRQLADGIALEEIAVLAPDPDPLAGLVADRLRRVPWHDGLFPVHVAGGLPLVSFAAGARALAVVRALRVYLAAEALVDLLPSLRLADEAERHLSRGTAADLLWSLGTVGGNPARPEGALEWSRRAADREAELEQQLATARAAEDKGDAELARTVRNLERRIGDLRAVRPALEALIEIAHRLVERTRLSALWPVLRAFFEQWVLQPGDGPRAHIVLEDRLGNIAADSTCGFLVGDDALGVVEEAILSTRISVSRFGEPAVFVGAVRDAVGLSFAAVRIIGLAEGHLPSVSREDPVIPDVMRDHLGQSGNSKARFLPTAADRAIGDLHAFDAVVRNAERRVALSAPRLDVDRSQREPSSLILEAAAALARPNSVTGEQNPIIPDRAALTRDAFAPSRAEAARFRRELPVGESAWHDGVAERLFGLPQRWRGTGALDLARIAQLGGHAYGIMDGLLSTESSYLSVPGLSADRPVSPSGIEDLLRCPHAFLFRQLLSFEEPAQPPSRREIGQPAYGQLFHAVAAEFYRQNGSSFCERTGKITDWVSIADQTVDGVFRNFLNEYPLVGAAVRAQQLDRLRHDVRELLEYDWETAGSRRFVATERAFGQPDPVAIRVGAELLFLRGRIDRIDIEGQKSMIRDLKTGRAHPRIGKQADPDPMLDIQIALYGMVAELLADEWHIPRQIASAYAYFGQRGTAERSFREDFHQVLEPAARQWLEVSVRLLSEKLFPRTPNADDCGYCCFRPVCGDGAYDRSSALLVSAQGVLADFAVLKGTKTSEQES